MVDNKHHQHLSRHDDDGYEEHNDILHTGHPPPNYSSLVVGSALQQRQHSDEPTNTMHLQQRKRSSTKRNRRTMNRFDHESDSVSKMKFAVDFPPLRQGYTRTSLAMAYVLDWTVLVLMFLLIGGFSLAPKPETMFPLNDPSLSYPLMPEIIPPWLFFLLCVGLPIILFMFIHVVFFALKKFSRWRKNLDRRQLHHGWLWSLCCSRGKQSQRSSSGDDDDDNEAMVDRKYRESPPIMSSAVFESITGRNSRDLHHAVLCLLN